MSAQPSVDIEISSAGAGSTIDLAPPPVSFSTFEFKTIGKPPALLGRLSTEASHVDYRSPSPESPPNTSPVDSQPSRSIRSIFQRFGALDQITEDSPSNQGSTTLETSAPSSLVPLSTSLSNHESQAVVRSSSPRTAERPLLSPTLPPRMNAKTPSPTPMQPTSHDSMDIDIPVSIPNTLRASSVSANQGASPITKAVHRDNSILANATPFLASATPSRAPSAFSGEGNAALDSPTTSTASRSHHVAHEHHTTFDQLLEHASQTRRAVPQHRATFTARAPELTASTTATLRSLAEVSRRLSQVLQLGHQTRAQAQRSMKEAEETEKLATQLIDAVEKTMPDFVKAKEDADKEKDMAEGMLGFVGDLLSWEESTGEEQQRLVQAAVNQVDAWQTQEMERKAAEVKAQQQDDLRKAQVMEEEKKERERLDAKRAAEAVEEGRKRAEEVARIAKAAEEEKHRQEEEQERHDRQRRDAAEVMRKKIQEDKLKAYARQSEAARANQAANRVPTDQVTSLPTSASALEREQDHPTGGTSRTVSGGVLVSIPRVTPPQRSTPPSDASISHSATAMSPPSVSAAHTRSDSAKSTASNGFVPAQTKAGRELDIEKPFASTTLASERLATASSKQDKQTLTSPSKAAEKRPARKQKGTTVDGKFPSSKGASPSSSRSNDANDNIIVKCEPTPEPTSLLTSAPAPAPAPVQAPLPQSVPTKQLPTLSVQTKPTSTIYPSTTVPQSNAPPPTATSRSSSTTRIPNNLGPQSHSPIESTRRPQSSNFYRSERSPDRRQARRNASGPSSPRISPTGLLGDGGWKNVHGPPVSDLGTPSYSRDDAVVARPMSPGYRRDRRGGDHYSPERQPLSPSPPQTSQRNPYSVPNLDRETASRKRRHPGGDDLQIDRFTKRRAQASDSWLPSKDGPFQDPDDFLPYIREPIHPGRGISYHRGLDRPSSPPRDRQESGGRVSEGPPVSRARTPNHYSPASWPLPPPSSTYHAMDYHLNDGLYRGNRAHDTFGYEEDRRDHSARLPPPPVPRPSFGAPIPLSASIQEPATPVLLDRMETFSSNEHNTRQTRARPRAQAKDIARGNGSGSHGLDKIGQSGSKRGGKGNQPQQKPSQQQQQGGIHGFPTNDSVKSLSQRMEASLPPRPRRLADRITTK